MSRETISYGCSESGTNCKIMSSVIAIGSVKSSVSAARLTMVSGSRTSDSE